MARNCAKTLYLDLNQGGMRVDASQPALSNFVDDLKGLCRDHKYSEINAVVQLVARRKDFYQMVNQIYWHRPYHVGYNESPDIWITFDEYINLYL